MGNLGFFRAEEIKLKFSLSTIKSKKKKKSHSFLRKQTDSQAQVLEDDDGWLNILFGK